MLVLTRKLGEEILIGDDIVLKVTALQGGRVRLGIEAPKHHRIVRPEAEGSTKATERPAAASEGSKGKRVLQLAGA